ncbi:hypothetical protein ACFYPC_34220 [Streptomyces sp. NPDC005808]|uniref:hypothetical protein n=1 Tax=Streptomyces sp. NPDC005808 TaxID=3364734 RepID=UPI0036BF6F9C
MTDDHHFADPAMTVVFTLAGEAQEPPALELRGLLDPAALEAALDHIAAYPPGSGRPCLVRHSPLHHNLTLPASTPTAPYPAGLLADLLTQPTPAHPRPIPAHPRPTTPPKPRPTPPEPGRPSTDSGATPPTPVGPSHHHPATPSRTPRTAPITPVQRERLVDALQAPQHQIEQLSWRWRGPLDPGLFAAAWQAVSEHEAVLRTAFSWDPHPMTVVHDHVTPR